MGPKNPKEKALKRERISQAKAKEKAEKTNIIEEKKQQLINKHKANPKSSSYYYLAGWR